MKQWWWSDAPSNPWLLFIIALALRLAFVLFYEQFPPFLGDDAGYDSTALNLANGRGFVQQSVDSVTGAVFEPVIAFGPTYPIFLALIYLLFGHSVMVVRVTQALLGTVIVIIVFRVARTAFDERVALMAGALTAVHPALITYTGMLVMETLFAFLLMLSVWAMIAAVKSQSLNAWLRAGIVLGLSVLLREEALAIILLFFGAVMWYGKKQHKTRNLLILSVTLMLTVGIWTLRNYVVFKEAILVSAKGGPTLWISTMGWSEWRNDEPYKSLVQGLNYLQRSHVLRREGIKNILADPAHYLRLCLERIAPFWLGSHTTYLAGFSDSFQAYYVQGALARVSVKAILLFLNIGLLILALWGTWVSVFKDRGQRYLRVICLSPVVAIAVVHFFLFATSRYQVPVLPFILMFSAVGVGEALRKLGFMSSYKVTCGPDHASIRTPLLRQAIFSANEA